MIAVLLVLHNEGFLKISAALMRLGGEGTGSDEIVISFRVCKARR